VYNGTVMNITNDAVPGYLTTMEAAQRFGRSDSQIRRLLESGKVRGKKFGHVWLVEIASLEHYMEHYARRRRRQQAP
jgi:excisionase family DNA binding protein